jgi:hypothetical protein
MSAETSTPRPRRFVQRLLLALAVTAGIALFVVASLHLGRRKVEKWQRERTERERRLAEAGAFGRVEGVVTLDGEPLGTVEVAFLPDPTLGTRGATANCYTDAQGHYALRTEKEDHDGALVGHHRVIVVDIAALPSPGGKPGKNRVPADYSDPFRTPLRVKVRPGPQTVNLDLVTPQPEPNP